VYIKLMVNGFDSNFKVKFSQVLKVATKL